MNVYKHSICLIEYLHYKVKIILFQIFLSYEDVDVMKIGIEGEYATSNSVLYLISRADTKENEPGNRIELFRFLLKDPRVNVNQRETERGELPLHRAAIMNDSR